MIVSEIMKKKPLCFDASDHVLEVAKKLHHEGRMEAPVVRMGKYIGMANSSKLAGVLGRAFKDPDSPAAQKAKMEPISRHLAYIPIFTRITLDPKMSISQAIAIHSNRNGECIPVLGLNKLLLGVVMAADLRKEMLREIEPKILKPVDLKLTGKGKVPQIDQGEKLDTAIDHVLDIVREKKEVYAEAVGAQLKMPLHIVEDYAENLERYGMLKIEYTVFGKMKLRKV